MPPRRERPQPRAPYPPRAGAARPPRPRPRWLVGALAGAVFGGAAASVPTYVVPGGSVFGAFHDLLELVSSAYPLGVGGGPPPPGGRRAADASDAAGVPPPSAALHDATLSTYARGKLAARLASSLRGADGGASDVPARRRLVGGAPVPSSGASAPAALFCDAHGLNATVPPRHWRRFPDDGCLHGRWLSAAGGGSAVPAAGGSADPADAPPFTFPIAWPFTALPVEEWCTLARLQPAVLAGFGVGDPKTLLLPDAGAFLELAERFPAWYEWVASLPGCVSSLNRAAALLQLHASWRRIDCSTPRGNCSAVDFPSALLPRVGAAYYYAGRDVDARPFVTSEKLTIGRVVNASGGVTCLVDTRRRFTFDPHVSPAVTAQFLGRDGNILLLDRVLSPRNEPLLRFPTASALDLLLGHPQLTNFSRLVVSSGLAPFFALGPLFSEQLLSALGADPPVLARVCAAALGAAVPTRACIAVLRFLHTSFHSVTLFAPLDAAFARLPPGVADFLADPANVDLARHVVLTHMLHGQTYLYDCSLASTARVWGRLDQRTASNAIVTVSLAYDSAAGGGGGWGGRRAQSGAGGSGAASASSSVGGNDEGGWSGGDPDAGTAPYGGQPAGAPADGMAGAGVAGAGLPAPPPEPVCDGGINIVPSRPLVLLLHFNNGYNPSPFSARTVATNFETTTGIVHKIDGVLLDGCAFCAATAGLYGSGGGDGGSFSILQCQCSGGNPFPLACSPAAGACPLDGNETAGWWPWRLGVAGGAFARRGGCRCPHRPWDAALVDDDGDVSRRRFVPWHTLAEEQLEEALATDAQWGAATLLQEFGGFRRLLMGAGAGTTAAAGVAAAEARWGVVAEP